MLRVITAPMSLVTQRELNCIGSFTGFFQLLILGSVMMLWSCQSMQNIGYWDRQDSTVDSDETESVTEESTESVVTETDTGSEDSSSNATDDSDDTGTVVDTTDSSETESDTETDTIDSETVDTETDTGPAYITVPFKPDEANGPFQFEIFPENNILALPGTWVAYVYDASMNTINQPLLTGSHDICVTGEVSISNPFQQTFAGVGVTFCPDAENMYNFYSFQNCPYTEATDDMEFVGVSYYIEGDAIPERIKFHIWRREAEAETQIALVGDIEVGLNAPGDYLFESLFDEANVPVNPAEINMVQFQVNGSTSSITQFDFCVRDFALLVREK